MLKIGMKHHLHMLVMQLKRKTISRNKNVILLLNYSIYLIVI